MEVSKYISAKLHKEAADDDTIKRNLTNLLRSRGFERIPTEDILGHGLIAFKKDHEVRVQVNKVKDGKEWKYLLVCSYDHWEDVQTDKGNEARVNNERKRVVEEIPDVNDVYLQIVAWQGVVKNEKIREGFSGRTSQLLAQKPQRQKHPDQDYRDKVTAYLKMYGYEEIWEPDTFFVFRNEEKDLTIRVYKYRGAHAWVYRLEFFNEEGRVHIEDPVKKNNVGNVIIDTEEDLI